MNRAGEAVPAHSAALFRIVFGLVGFVVVMRFFAFGWIDTLFLDPPLHLPYPGLEWVRPWPGFGMYLHFAVMAVAAAGIALGAWYRVSAAVFAATLWYVELIDQTLYLNHYYWMALTAVVITFLPLDRVWSVDARRRWREPVVPRLTVWTLRAQVGMVYLFAGVAKIGADWLFAGQPLATWLPARSEMPIMGPLLAMPSTALAASWAAALFDLTIVGWLLWGRSRLAAYVVLVAFHVGTWLLFPSIGVFPLVMIGASLVFFPPDWPLRLRGSPAQMRAVGGDRRVSRMAVASLALYAAVMVAIPLRHLAIPGDVLWSGEGYAFSWRVMLTEKAGSVLFHITDREGGATWVEELPAELTDRQREVVATSPGLIADVARIVADRHRGAGRDVEVRADAFVSFNGRPSRPIVDPEIDLAAADE